MALCRCTPGARVSGSRRLNGAAQAWWAIRWIDGCVEMAVLASDGPHNLGYQHVPRKEVLLQYLWPGCQLAINTTWMGGGRMHQVSGCVWGRRNDRPRDQLAGLVITRVPDSAHLNRTVFVAAPRSMRTNLGAGCKSTHTSAWTYIQVSVGLSLRAQK
jgi:hypothetical protein